MSFHLHSSTHAIRAIRDAPIDDDDDDDASISRPRVHSRTPSLFVDDSQSERCLATHRVETDTKVDVDDVDAFDVFIGTR